MLATFFSPALKETTDVSHTRLAMPSIAATGRVLVAALPQTSLWRDTGHSQCIIPRARPGFAGPPVLCSHQPSSPYLPSLPRLPSTRRHPDDVAPHHTVPIRTGPHRLSRCVCWRGLEPPSTRALDPLPASRRRCSAVPLWTGPHRLSLGCTCWRSAEFVLDATATFSRLLWTTYAAMTLLHTSSTDWGPHRLPVICVLAWAKPPTALLPLHRPQGPGLLVSTTLRHLTFFCELGIAWCYCLTVGPLVLTCRLNLGWAEPY
jgi:hypothetical protein